MRASFEHPSDNILTQVLVAEFEYPAEIESHLSDCARCQDRLEQLANQSGVAEHLKSLYGDVALEGERYLAESVQRRSGQFSANADEWNWSQVLDQSGHPELLGRLGRYDIERVIGSGGMGVVFKGYDGDLHRPVAIKLLAPQLMSHATARARFTREARAAAAIVHDHVIGIYNVEGQAAHPYLVMQYVNGESLQQRLDRVGQLELCQILRIASQVADGLAAAHSQGIVHRDLKPANILLEHDVERVLLADFGLASAVDDIRLTTSGFYPGTPQFMSPEQVKGEIADFRSDLFSLGCVLYAMCSGHPPFRARSSYAVLRQIADQQPRCLRELNPSIPYWLEKIIFKLLAKEPADRWQSAGELRDVLIGCLSHVQKPTAVELPAECRVSAAQPSALRVLLKNGVAMSLASVGIVLIVWLSNWMASIPRNDPEANGSRLSSALENSLLGMEPETDRWSHADVESQEIDLWLRKMEKESLLDWNGE